MLFTSKYMCKLGTHISNWTKKLKRSQKGWVLISAMIHYWKQFWYGKVDTSLFIRRKEKYLVVIENYVNDIIFGPTDGSVCEEFANLVKKEFGISMIGEPMLFFGLHITETSGGISLPSPNMPNILKKCGMDSVKPCTTLMSSSIKIDKVDMN